MVTGTLLTVMFFTMESPRRVDAEMVKWYCALLGELKVQAPAGVADAYRRDDDEQEEQAAEFLTVVQESQVESQNWKGTHPSPLSL